MADVIAIFLRDKAQDQANPTALAKRCGRLLDWWGEKNLAEVTTANCIAYERSRGSSGGIRRELEDLRAAINYHAKEGLHVGTVNVRLPDKGAPRDRWLTRSEAAKLLWACWRAKEKQRRSRKGPSESLPTKKWTRRHVARFILLGLYTGTRAGAVASASLKKGDGRSYVDIENGLFYRLAGGKKATKKRQPPVPLPERLMAHIRRWKETGISKDYIVEYHGKPVQSVKVAFGGAAEDAGLGEGVTPHTLRHTAATWLMQAGVDIWEASGFLGMTTQQLEGTYGHHHPHYMKGASKAMGRRPGAAKVTPTKPVNRTRTKATEGEQETEDSSEVPDA